MVIATHHMKFAATVTFVAYTGAATAQTGAEGTLSLFANGEALATEGFLAPELTRDGWELRFDHVYVTLAGVSAFQTDPPYDAEAGGAPEAAVRVPFDMAAPRTIDLTNTGADGRVFLGDVAGPEGHYNAIAWSVVPAPSGEWTGHAMVLIGTAAKDGESVAFTLTNSGTQDYVCGEYVGAERKGFVAADGTADLELTFHLDHVFGRLDKGPEDAMNTGALGFDRFSGGGTQAINLDGLHIGHVGEGHCAVTHR